MPDEAKGQHSPAGFRIGTEFTREQIDEAISAAVETGNRQEALRIVPHQDTSGHGTGVAAVAASSNSNVLIRGVAPGCDLLAVKLGTTPENDFPGTTQLMRGVTYAFRKALELNRPVVINLSYGNSYGSHDGSSLLERFLDNASGVGRNVICVGSGNEGAGGGHVEGNVKTVNRVELSVAERELTLNVQLWKAYEDRFGVTLETPSGQQYEVILEGRPGRQEVLLGKTKMLIYVGMPTPYSSLQELFFVFLPTETYVDSGIWSWLFKPEKIVSGAFQMYLPTAQQRNAGTRFFQPTPNLTLTIPSTARGVISVAAYNDTLNAYADFSGRGLPDSGQIYLDSEGGKPDLAAPGVSLLAARAGGGTESYTGTSFATPMVSGAAALLMEWGEGVIIRLRGPLHYSFVSFSAKNCRFLHIALAINKLLLYLDYDQKSFGLNSRLEFLLLEENERYRRKEEEKEKEHMGKEYLVEGAKLMCVHGSEHTFLQIPKGHGYTSGGKKKANCLDCVAGKNIQPFGACAKNEGNHQCEGYMQLVERWESMSISTTKPEKVNGEDALTMDSVLLCKRGGIILPLTSGQGYERGVDWEAFTQRFVKMMT